MYAKFPLLFGCPDVRTDPEHPGSNHAWRRPAALGDRPGQRVASLCREGVH